MVFIEKKISEKKKRGVQRSCDRCKGDGRGVANGHMTVGGRGEGQGEGGAGARGGRQARHSGPVRPIIWASQARPV